MDTYTSMFFKSDYKEFPKEELKNWVNKVKDYSDEDLLDIPLFRKRMEQDVRIPIDERIILVNKPDRELAVVMAKAKLTEK
jgi:hypothetical protein